MLFAIKLLANIIFVRNESIYYNLPTTLPLTLELVNNNLGLYYSIELVAAARNIFVYIEAN